VRQFTTSPFIAVLALSACLLGTSSMPGCSSPSQRQLELDREYTEQTRFRVQLTSELLDIADTAASLFQAEVIRARLNGRPEREIAYLELTRNNAAANYRSLALGQDAWGALVDLYVFSELSNAAQQAARCNKYHGGDAERKCIRSCNRCSKSVRERRRIASRARQSRWRSSPAARGDSRDGCDCRTLPTCTGRRILCNHTSSAHASSDRSRPRRARKRVTNHHRRRHRWIGHSGTETGKVSAIPAGASKHCVNQILLVGQHVRGE